MRGTEAFWAWAGLREDKGGSWPPDSEASLCRASVRDMLGLWESLQQRGEARLLRAAEEKFTIEPFQAQSPKDVEDLGHLVQR